MKYGQLIMRLKAIIWTCLFSTLVFLPEHPAKSSGFAVSNTKLVVMSKFVVIKQTQMSKYKINSD